MNSNEHKLWRQSVAALQSAGHCKDKAERISTRLIDVLRERRK